jgi:cytochrome P450
MSQIYYDPYDYEIDADPYPVWKRMRDEAPLYRNDKYGFWALSRFDDVANASRDHQTFSSARGTVLEMIDKLPDARPMIFHDRPEHGNLRGLVSRAFSPGRIAALEPMIRKIVVDLLEPLEAKSRFDYLEDFGSRVPMLVISTMLGIPEEDREQIRVWTDERLHRAEGEDTLPQERVAEIMRKFQGYLADYIAQRRKAPRDDMMSDLIAAEIHGKDGSVRKLTDPEIIMFIGLLSGAGNETVARLLGNAGAILSQYPLERDKLLRRPELIPNAVEELLRYEAPSPAQARTLTRDVDLHGVTVPAGDIVLLLTGSAGRDERVYSDPDTFDVERVIDRHVSLGQGIHFCLGAALARLEGKVALEETLARIPHWQVDWENCERVHTSTVRGYAKLPVYR